MVSAAGGLLDSVQDGVTGLHFEIIEGPGGAPYDREATRQSVTRGLHRAVRLYADPAKVQTLRLSGMHQDHSWNNRIRTSFAPLFKSVLTGTAARARNATERLKCSEVLLQ